MCREYISKEVERDRKEVKISQVRFWDKYIAIKEFHEKEDLNFVLLCDIEGVSRAAYYKWLKRNTSSRELQN